MTTPPRVDERQLRKDNNQLKLLCIFHFVVAMISLLLIVSFIVGGFIIYCIFTDPKMMHASTKGGTVFWHVSVWVYTVGGIIESVWMVLNLLSGVFLARKQCRTFSLVVAGANCISCPGIILGVFTFVVLMRDSVRRMYEVSDKGA